MFERRSSEFQYLEGYGQNSNVWKNKVRILMSGRLSWEFQCLDESG